MTVETAQHTPGPWRTGPLTGEDEAGLRYIVGPTDMLLAKVYAPADARLIAAAPELLAALEESEQYCAANMVPGREVLDRLQAAIRKARGESA